MREIFTSGSVGRAPGNRCFYPERDPKSRAREKPVSTQGEKMSLIEDLKGLNTNAAVLIAIFFVAFIAPAFLLIYRFNNDLFVKLDTVKLIILSVSITSPSFIFLFVTTWVADAVTVHMGYHEKGHLGTMTDWFVTHGISNTTILYIVTFLTYAFDLQIKTVVWCLLGLLFLYTIHEFWRVLFVAKGPKL